MPCERVLGALVLGFHEEADRAISGNRSSVHSSLDFPLQAVEFFAQAMLGLFL